jgi:hypothetical protein
MTRIRHQMIWEEFLFEMIKKALVLDIERQFGKSVRYEFVTMYRACE